MSNLPKVSSLLNQTAAYRERSQAGHFPADTDTTQTKNKGKIWIRSSTLYKVLLSHSQNPQTFPHRPNPHHRLPPWLVSPPAHSPSNPFFTIPTNPLCPPHTSLASASAAPPPSSSPFRSALTPPPFLPAPAVVTVVVEALFVSAHLKKTQSLISPPLGILYCVFLWVLFIVC